MPTRRRQLDAFDTCVLFGYFCWSRLVRRGSGRRPGRPLVAKSKKTNENEQIPPAADAMLDTAVTDCQAGQGASFRTDEIVRVVATENFGCIRTTYIYPPHKNTADAG